MRLMDAETHELGGRDVPGAHGAGLAFQRSMSLMLGLPPAVLRVRLFLLHVSGWSGSTRSRLTTCGTVWGMTNN